MEKRNGFHQRILLPSPALSTSLMYIHIYTTSTSSENSAIHELYIQILIQIENQLCYSTLPHIEEFLLIQYGVYLYITRKICVAINQMYFGMNLLTPYK